MTKLTMQTQDATQANIRRIAELFPQCVAETYRNGKSEWAVDFDALQQELQDSLVEAGEERYQFTWPDKRKAQLLANVPIRSTLRPCREESVDFDTTRNLYIEGDNLDVLKCLKETYTGQVKMIYIDPPYNTGNDFVYSDDFAESEQAYLARSGQYDEQGNRLVENKESNGRFHTDWLNMIYPRLKVARDLLTDDGVIFISIDDNEVENLRKVCDEIFGECNFQSCITWRRRTNQPNDKSKMVARVAEFILVYSKNDVYLSNNKLFNGVPLSEKRKAEYTNPDNDSNGAWSTNPWKAATGRGGTRYKIETPTGIIFDEVWYGTQETFNNLVKQGRVYWTDGGNGYPRIKIYLKDAEKEGQAAINWFTCEQYGSNQEGSAEMDLLFNEKGIFSNPKPTKLINSLSHIATNKDSLILDFFSGSATTAHAVMQLNAEDGGNRRFIMVQLPEQTDERSEAYKAGYRNICEIGKERIRRAGAKIKADNPLTTQDLDTGFRVLKLDDSNMLDVFYAPADLRQADLFAQADNIRPDRTPEDLLFQTMLSLGISLDSNIAVLHNADLGLTAPASKSYTIFDVAANHLLACFDTDITDEVITAIAKRRPNYVVLRDAGLASDATATNFEQLFRTYAPNTIVRTL